MTSLRKCWTRCTWHRRSWWMTTLRKQVQGFLKPPFSHWRKHRPLLPGSEGGSSYKENRKVVFFLFGLWGRTICLSKSALFWGKSPWVWMFQRFGWLLKTSMSNVSVYLFFGELFVRNTFFLEDCIIILLCSQNKVIKEKKNKPSSPVVLPALHSYEQCFWLSNAHFCK